MVVEAVEVVIPSPTAIPTANATSTPTIAPTPTATAVPTPTSTPTATPTPTAVPSVVRLEAENSTLLGSAFTYGDASASGGMGAGGLDIII